MAALEHCEAEGKIKIFSAIAMVSRQKREIFFLSSSLAQSRDSSIHPRE